MKLDDNKPGAKTLHTFSYADRVVLEIDGTYTGTKNASTGTVQEQCTVGFHKITVGCHATLWTLITLGDPPIYRSGDYVDSDDAGGGDRNDFVVHPPIPSAPIPLNWPP